MLQVLVISDALQLVLDNLLDILLYLIVVVLYGLFHTVVAIGILEVVDDGDRLIIAFLSLHLGGINDNLCVENLLFGENGACPPNSCGSIHPLLR